jgi:lactate permease
MTPLIALLPCAAVLITVLWLRLSGIVAASAAAATAFIIWLAGVFVEPSTLSLWRAFQDTILLELLVAAVVLPGILFVEISSRGGALNAINDILHVLALTKPKAAIFIATGVGVMLESLTGMGVSLLVTVPLLMALVERYRAIGLALVSMSLMPWGGLSISVLVGAELGGLQTRDLSLMVWRVSGPVAAALPMLCLMFVPKPSIRDLTFAILAGLLLSSAIGVATYWIGVEVAGVAGGLAVIAFSMLQGLQRSHAGKANGLGAALIAPALRPYAILIIAVVAQKLLIPLLNDVGIAPALSTGRITFTLLSSPGVALLVASIASLALQRQRDHGSTTKLPPSVLRRAWRPLTSIVLFLASARLLVESGAITALANLLAGLGAYPAVAAVTSLGALSGYVTGSGVAANALFLPGATSTGQIFGAEALFAALQNSAASHAAMAALPVAAILLSALPHRTSADDHTAMSLGLRLSALLVMIIFMTGALLLATGLHQP